MAKSQFSLTQDSMRRKVLKASAINGSGFILTSIIVLLWSFLLVQSYSGIASGQLLLSLSVAGLINLLDLGVSIGLIRVISTPSPTPHQYSPWNYFRAAMWVTILLEIVAGALAVSCWRAYSFPNLPLSGYFSIVVFAVSTQVIQLCSGLFKGLFDFKAANKISTGSALSVYGGGVAMILTGQEVWSVLLAMTGVQLLTACASVAFATVKLRTNEPAATSSLFQVVTAIYPNLLRSSLKMYPQMFTGIFFMHAQRFIIAHYAGLSELGIISLAYSIATRLHSLVNAFLEVIFPIAGQLQAQGFNMGALCVRSGMLCAAAYCFVAAAVTAVVSTMVPGIAGPLSAFSIGVAFAVAAVPTFHFLNGSGASAQVSLCSILSPPIFMMLTIAIHNLFRITGNLLLPVAYSATMAVMVIQVGFLLRHHLQRLAISCHSS